MINLRRRLFSSTLGVAHGYKARIDTPRIDSGEIKPPSMPNRRRSPEEYAALKAEVEKQLVVEAWRVYVRETRAVREEKVRFALPSCVKCIRGKAHDICTDGVDFWFDA